MLFIEIIQSLFGIAVNPIEGIVIMVLGAFIFLEILEWLFRLIYLIICPVRSF
jgi:hypothetical protein